MPLLTKNGKRPSGASKQPAEVKKAKLPPPTKEQKEALLSYMERHTLFANNRLKAKNAALLKKSMLLRLAEQVNAVKGQSRDGKKWYKCWTDMRLYAKQYAATHCSRSLPTGGGGPDMSINSETSFEGAATGEGAEEYTSNDAQIDRIMKIIGWHCALGLNVPDELNSDTEDKENEENETAMNEDDDDDVTDDGVLNIEVVPVSSSTPAKKAERPKPVSRTSSNDETCTNSSNNSTSNRGCCCAQLIEKLEKNNELLQKVLDQLSNSSVTVVVPQEMSAINSEEISIISPITTDIPKNVQTENIQTEIEEEFSNHMREDLHLISEDVPVHIFDLSDDKGSYLLNDDPFVPQG